MNGIIPCEKLGLRNHLLSTIPPQNRTWNASVSLKYWTKSYSPFGNRIIKMHSVVDLENSQRHAIITGGNSGIGMATAMALAAQNFTLTLACRDLERGQAAADKVREATGNSAVSVDVCDLASLDSIRGFAERYKNSGQPLHVLVNNAGVMAPPLMRTRDGFELQFGVNHVGHFELTRILLPLLAASGSEKAFSRVVVVTSAAEMLGNIDFEDLNFTKSRYYFRWNAYAQSKLANSLFTFELARRLAEADQPVTANCYHPGIVDTELIRYFLPKYIMESRKLKPEASRKFARLIGLKTAEEGASTGVVLATGCEMERVNGYYFVDQKKSTPSKNAQNVKLGSELWKATESLVSHKFCLP